MSFMTGRILLSESDRIDNSQSEQSSPLVAIIILTWNNSEITVGCLQTLRKLAYPRFWIAVVDNNSSDGTVDVVRKQFPECTLITNPQNLGFAGGANIGIRHAIRDGAEFVLLLNNDTVVPVNLIDILVDRAESQLETGIFMPRISKSSGDQAEWFIGSRQHWLTLDARDFSASGMRNTADLQDNQVDFLFGTAMFIRANVFEKIGLFDEDYFLYYEDMDFCNRARRAGYQLRVVHEITVKHQISASTKVQESFRDYHKARSSVIYYRKQGLGIRWVAIVPYRLYSALLTILSMLKQGRHQSIRAYLSGLRDGLQVKLRAPL